VGASMSRLSEAVSWSGVDVSLILFVVWGFDPGSSAPTGGSSSLPRDVKIYRLEDPERRLGARELYEYDLVFDELPPDFDQIVTSWLRAALEAGAEAAWFAFEGSFDFEHLLTADIANQVFALADANGIFLALEDGRREGRAWLDVVEAVRDRRLTRLGAERGC